MWKKTKHTLGLETLIEKGREADPECVVCHVTGFTYVSGFSNAKATRHLGVIGCENCHGVGSLHRDNPASGFGWAGGEKACVGCHNPDNSPNFDFSSYWDQIKH
ncbi:MAG: multiheme c-type cytochrome [Planctomycetota bacterium]|nr:multiheme c-type cytochrome [Planctomycetota bacterium]